MIGNLVYTCSYVQLVDYFVTINLISHLTFYIKPTDDDRSTQILGFPTHTYGPKEAVGRITQGIKSAHSLRKFRSSFYLH